MLKVDKLTKSFNGKIILKDLSFSIEKGEIAVFLGESGVGKSTLLRVLNNLETFDSGLLNLDGLNLNLRDAHETNSIGMVFQHFNLFENLTVEDNIIVTMMNCKDLTRKKVEDLTAHLLCKYELHEFSKFRVSQLSGGQKQRLAIARTVAVNPKIICLDEPTSALDPRLTTQVAKYITELCKDNRIVILTTHDMSLLEKLDARMFLMKEGSIIETASKAEYFANPQKYARFQTYFGTSNFA